MFWRRLLLVALLPRSRFLLVLCSFLVVALCREVFVRSVPSMFDLLAYKTSILSHVLVAFLFACAFEIVPPLLGCCLVRPEEVTIVRGLSVAYKLFLQSPVLVEGIIPILNSPYCKYVL